jgi:hypothetical protein
MPIVIQVNHGYYRNWFPMDMFFFLIVKVFKCLHQQADKFLHQFVNMTWGVKGIKGPPTSILHTFFRQKVYVAL